MIWRATKRLAVIVWAIVMLIVAALVVLVMADYDDTDWPDHGGAA